MGDGSRWRARRNAHWNFQMRILIVLSPCRSGNEHTPSLRRRSVVALLATSYGSEPSRSGTK
jgi:hypothetical protein